MSKKFGDVVFNLRRAKVTESVGEMVLELEGDPADIDDAMEWLKGKKIQVRSIVHDAVES